MKLLGFRVVLHVVDTPDGEGEERLDVYVPKWATNRPAVLQFVEGCALLFFLVRGERSQAPGEYPSGS
jgi:hypothetical protein